jgi:hypothetical protein
MRLKWGAEQRVIDRLGWKTTRQTLLLAIIGGGSMDLLRWLTEDKGADGEKEVEDKREKEE